MKPDTNVFVDEWQKAAQRLTKDADVYGGVEPAVLSWLLTFAETPLETLSLGQRGDLVMEWLRFAFDKGLGLQDRKIQSLTVGTLGLQDLSKIQQAIRIAINEFLDKQEVTFPKTEGAFTVSRATDGNTVFRFGGDLPGNTFFMAATLLSQFGSRVMRCQNCRRLMLVARQDRKLFCSESCRVAAWRKERTAGKTPARPSAKAARIAKKGLKR